MTDKINIKENIGENIREIEGIAFVLSNPDGKDGVGYIVRNKNDDENDNIIIKLGKSVSEAMNNDSGISISQDDINMAKLNGKLKGLKLKEPISGILIKVSGEKGEKVETKRMKKMTVGDFLEKISAIKPDLKQANDGVRRGTANVVGR